MAVASLIDLITAIFCSDGVAAQKRRCAIRYNITLVVVVFGQFQAVGAAGDIVVKECVTNLAGGSDNSLSKL
jgi:hypothetical protein